MVADVQCALCRDSITDPVESFPRPNCASACLRNFKPHEKCFRDSLAFKNVCSHCHQKNPLNDNFFTRIWRAFTPDHMHTASSILLVSAASYVLSKSDVINNWAAILDDLSAETRFDKNPGLEVPIKTAVLLGFFSVCFIANRVAQRRFGDLPDLHED